MAVSSLSLNDVKVSVSINRSTEQIVTPQSIALSADNSIAFIFLDQIKAVSTVQSVEYSVLFNGEKTTADPFDVNVEQN